MRKFKVYGTVENDKLTILNKDRYKEGIKKLNNLEVEIVFKKKGQRSSKQNRYYWGVVLEEIRLKLLELGTETDVESIHEWAKIRFNPDNVITPAGELIELGGTTTEMNTEEFSIEYVDKIREWASQSLEIFIPDPGKQTAFDYE